MRPLARHRSPRGLRLRRERCDMLRSINATAKVASKTRFSFPRAILCWRSGAFVLCADQWRCCRSGEFVLASLAAAPMGHRRASLLMERTSPAQGAPFCAHGCRHECARDRDGRNGRSAYHCTQLRHPASWHRKHNRYLVMRVRIVVWRPQLVACSLRRQLAGGASTGSRTALIPWNKKWGSDGAVTVPYAGRIQSPAGRQSKSKNDREWLTRQGSRAAGALVT